jgi:hypothetical protein
VKHGLWPRVVHVDGDTRGSTDERSIAGYLDTARGLESEGERNGAGDAAEKAGPVSRYEVDEFRDIPATGANDVTPHGGPRLTGGPDLDVPGRNQAEIAD